MRLEYECLFRKGQRLAEGLRDDSLTDRLERFYNLKSRV